MHKVFKSKLLKLNSKRVSNIDLGIRFYIFIFTSEEKYATYHKMYGISYIVLTHTSVLNSTAVK